MTRSVGDKRNISGCVFAGLSHASMRRVAAVGLFGARGTDRDVGCLACEGDHSGAPYTQVEKVDERFATELADDDELDSPWSGLGGTGFAKLDDGEAPRK